MYEVCCMSLSRCAVSDVDGLWCGVSTGLSEVMRLGELGASLRDTSSNNRLPNITVSLLFWHAMYAHFMGVLSLTLQCELQQTVYCHIRSVDSVSDTWNIVQCVFWLFVGDLLCSSGTAQINKVTLCQAQLVLRWVTILWVFKRATHVTQPEPVHGRVWVTKVFGFRGKYGCGLLESWRQGDRHSPIHSRWVCAAMLL